MTFGGRNSRCTSMESLYRALMGQSFDTLDDRIRRFHTPDPYSVASGRFNVKQGRNLAARLIAWLFRLPSPGLEVPVQLKLESYREGSRIVEKWSRTFNGQRLESRQFAVDDSCLAERFGLIEFRFRLLSRNGTLVYQPAGAAIPFGSLRLPLPRGLSPSREDYVAPSKTDDAAMEISVNLNLPMVGTVVAYQGTLIPELSAR